MPQLSTAKENPHHQNELSALPIELSNGVRLEFTLDGEMLHGLTHATIDGVPLIAEGSARLPYVETRDGWLISGYRFCDIQHDGDTVILTAEALGVKPGMGRKVDFFGVPFITTPRRTPVVLGTFRWLLTPESVAIGHPGVRQATYQGFSYRYEFQLDHAFHWVLDSGTWEVGGDPDGVTIFSQHQAAIGGPMLHTVSRQGPCYTSGETFRRNTEGRADVVPDIPLDPSLGYIIPIQAQLRGAAGSFIDVQYKQDDLLLCYYAQADYYRTLVEWRTDDPGIGHLDHHFFPLTQAYVTPAKTILAAHVPGLTQAQMLNRWTDCWEHVASAWRAQTGVSRQEPITGLGLDLSGAAGVHYGSGPTDLFARWEARFDWMREHGMEYLFIGGLGHHQGEIAPMIANMCQPHDYTVTERYGGPERFRLFCERAHAAGIKIALWICGHLSDHAPALKAHPEWTVSADTGTPWDGGYRIMRACSYHRGFIEWLLAQMRDLKDLGLDLLFFDSYHNLAAMPIDYADPTLSPQIHQLWAFQAECERIGLPMMIESVGPLGVTSCGLWPEYLICPELTYWTHFRSCIDARMFNDFTNGTLTTAMYFRLLANKAPIGFSVLEQANDTFEGSPDLPAEIGPMACLYQQLTPAMQVRTVNEDGSIAWCNPASGERVLFAVGTGSVTVPDGYRAEPVYGTSAALPAGTHATNDLAAYRLEQL
ncbi:MAG TPA: hypothetical protein VGL77_15710 [Armatimonadota bacterium]